MARPESRVVGEALQAVPVEALPDVLPAGPREVLLEELPEVVRAAEAVPEEEAAQGEEAEGDRRLPPLRPNTQGTRGKRRSSRDQG
ncbi:hypothetical protein GCM10009730_50360 [Streptomyces albidochromogenes]